MGARLGLPTCLAGRNQPPLDEVHGLAIWTAVGGFGGQVTSSIAWQPSSVLAPAVRRIRSLKLAYGGSLDLQKRSCRE